MNRLYPKLAPWISHTHHLDAIADWMTRTLP